ncbi:RelA/SpoT family protein [Acuticoccus mangrovi]|uniref:GTP pyrophosphokinase rsh n=1 Tax=Acuticoccus mangrovi TaxID=2796142 RepID=A0A934MJD9_9HYPH|nr:bifunctional (p)ppGpp synthetase/guanosine-3',5'-bis(diphosphate) 3'-pyrophosphohydrolase [Acuticoccus mangrovi]MBJ3778196.1 bifunctional (p)ppGpp synthetase/guanosine-3',5'-bis(diphosphate) 3'-pyrophosphohydrolase [Acuticoccus mangrovi]
MMRQYELVERVAQYNPDVDEALLNRAYVYSMRKHGDQKRASGDPYFSHPLEVAAILTQMRLDDATIATALLHDTIEDTDATRQEIDQLFGEEIGKLVEGLTKIARLHLVNQEDKQGENLRKLLLAVADDVRVLLVKLADRLHNMRTLHYVPPGKRRRIAEETMEVYAPLAGKMGIQWMREELEALAFAVLYPEDHTFIEKKLAERRAHVGPLLIDIETDLRQKLAENDIKARVSGREKKPYSIFLKMKRKHINFENLSDIYAFRIIVDTVPECYAALGVIHTIWQSVPGRFKDYISTPKQNDYQSLHTTVVGPRKQRVELQIRTHEMHRVAEYGIAAHVLYKDQMTRGHSQLAKDSNAYAWLRHTIELLSDGGSSAEFLENTKLELFQDRVFCFTPRGKLIALPPGATPIDFAYQVHTDIGNTCIGCKINGRSRPLVTPLQSGDEVEIICKAGATPPSAWNTLAVTGKARAAIRKANREADRRKFIRLGQQLIDNEIARRELSDEQSLKPDLALAAERLGAADPEALAFAIGSGALAASAVLTALGHAAEPLGPPTNGIPVPIRGIGGDLPVSFAPQHYAIPGDNIVGILQPGEGVTVYPATAREALSRYTNEPQRWLPLSWDLDGAKGSLFPVGVRVLAANERGALAEVAGAIAEEGGNIDDLSMTQKTPQFREMNLHIEVADKAHLGRIIDRLKSLTIVSEAARSAH